MYYAYTTRLEELEQAFVRSPIRVSTTESFYTMRMCAQVKRAVIIVSVYILLVLFARVDFLGRSMDESRRPDSPEFFCQDGDEATNFFSLFLESQGGETETDRYRRPRHVRETDSDRPQTGYPTVIPSSTHTASPTVIPEPLCLPTYVQTPTHSPTVLSLFLWKTC